MLKTPDVFIAKYNGRRIDIDNSSGVQCVDAFKVFLRWIGAPMIPTYNGWANGYWTVQKDRKALEPYFDFITDPKKLQPGDWCIWDKGSSCPDSHIAMFVNYTSSAKTSAYVFSERQGGNREFRTKEHKLDILGALRWKEWAAPDPENINAKQPAYNFTKATAGSYKTKTDLNIRDGAGLQYKILATMPKGSTFTTYGYHTGQWYYGVYKNGKQTVTGFANKFNLERKKTK